MLFSTSTKPLSVTKGLAILALVIAAAAVPLSAQSGTKLVMGWTDWKPFMMADLKTNQPSGLDIEIIQAAVKEMGFTLELRDLPWARQDKEVVEGSIDMVAGYGVNDKVAGLTQSAAYRTGTNVLIMRKGDVAKYPIAAWADILKYKDFRIGCIQGATGAGGPEFVELIKSNAAFKARIDEGASATEQNFDKLLAGRVAAIINGEASAVYIMQQKGWTSKLEVHPFEVTSSTAHAMFCDKTVRPETVALFNKALATIKSNGTYDAILKKYGLMSRKAK